MASHFFTFARCLPIFLLLNLPGLGADNKQLLREQFHVSDKTLVAWAIPSDLRQRGSGILTLQEDSRFDSIVLGEIEAGKWMPGSDMFYRTHRVQSRWDLETETTQHTKIPLCLAIVYKGNSVTMYRNGRRYCSYEVESQQPFNNRSEIVAGLRLSTGSYGPFAGIIDEIRLYGIALTDDEVASLELHKHSEPVPAACWRFEEGSLTDEQRLFLDGELHGNAKIVDGKLILDGTNDSHFIARLVEPWKPAAIQAGFYTPRRVGGMWDTWVYYYKGIWYQYYLAGNRGSWDGFELMTSPDGVHWKQFDNPVLKPRAGTTWMGTGHIIEGPNFDKQPHWIMNYSEWFGDKQDIMFATSDDLIHWKKVDESNRFTQDTRWYLAKGRWDCIDSINIDGTYHGYFTADPDPTKNPSPVCGFGHAESQDGVHWRAAAPVSGNITGEFGGIQKIGEKYYITISEGRIACSESHLGPFIAQSKNPNMFDPGFDMYFPRFVHNPPVDATLDKNGVLVNHFYMGGMGVFSAPLKAVEIDHEGILRLKWWKGNEKLKRIAAAVGFEQQGARDAQVSFLSNRFDPNESAVVEAALSLSSDPPEKTSAGFYFDQGDGTGSVLLVNQSEAVFGTMAQDGSGLKINVRCRRDMAFGSSGTLRIVFHKDLMEAYLNDYLVMLKRVPWNGRLGLVGESSSLHAWKSDLIK